MQTNNDVILNCRFLVAKGIPLLFVSVGFGA